MSTIGLGLMIVFLSLATFVQLNDPDSLIWMMIYGLPCLLTLAAFINRNIVESTYWWIACTTVFTGVLALFVLQTSITLTVDNVLRWDVISTEEGREAIGLGIVLIWLILLSHKADRRDISKKDY
ncbi:transmembrane protein 220-like isoform X2 [Halichondria panicea]|uniref:transmembrane protein 220-like isoform X2 n=1 Tax=Halichondria panicea TaxID=6063 RepID=UPI00312B7E66